MRQPLSPVEGKLSLSFGGVGRPQICKLRSTLVHEIDVSDADSTAGTDIALEEDHGGDEGRDHHPVEQVALRHPVLWDPSPVIGILQISKEFQGPVLVGDIRLLN